MNRPAILKCALNYSFQMSAFSSQNPLYGLSQRPSNQGWLFHPKTPYTGNQDNFSTATGVHPNRFQHAFIQTQSMGASPLYPQPIFCIHTMVLASMQTSCSRSNFSQANGLRRRRPRKGLFPLSAETHDTSRRDMGKCASCLLTPRIKTFRSTNGCRLGVGKLWHFAFLLVWMNPSGGSKIFMDHDKKSLVKLPPLYAVCYSHH